LRKPFSFVMIIAGLLVSQSRIVITPFYLKEPTFFKQLLAKPLCPQHFLQAEGESHPNPFMKKNCTFREI